MDGRYGNHLEEEVQAERRMSDGGYLEQFSDGDTTNMPFRNQGNLSIVKRGGDDERMKRRHSKRVVELESLLEHHHVAPDEQKKVLHNIQLLEDDLALVKRSLGQKNNVMRSTKVQKQELVSRVDQLEERIKDLIDAIKKKEKLIIRLRSQAMSFEEDVRNLQGENVGLQQERSRTLQTQTTLSTCGFLPASKLFITPEERRQQKEYQMQLQQGHVARASHHAKRRGSRKSKGGVHGKQSGTKTHKGLAQEDPRPTRPSPLSILLELIEQSHSSIDVMCHVFSNVTFANALAAASSRGVTVRVIFDATWLEFTLSASSISKPKQNWESIHRRWSANGVEFRTQHGPMHTSRPSPIFAPFRHNVVIVDGTTLITGPYQFADSSIDEESSLIAIQAQSEDRNECISEVQTLFDAFWAHPAVINLPVETTVVKLPPLM
eukprot:m.58632 g.58632  ORF g.58632 m.58632 type:complete len:435 (+) comp7872_c0_seq2:154-1458(+)